MQIEDVQECLRAFKKMQSSLDSVCNFLQRCNDGQFCSFDYLLTVRHELNTLYTLESFCQKSPHLERAEELFREMITRARSNQPEKMDVSTTSQ